MSPILSAAVLVPTAAVVVALFAVLWRERAGRRDARTALVAGGALAASAAATAAMARQGLFQPRDAGGVPPVGIALAASLSVLAACLATSPSLRHMLSRQASLVRLHLWRFEGVVFLILLLQGAVPALWALPAGLGDVLVAATAPWIARRLETPRGKRRAVAWNLLGMVDLIVAVGLGVTTNPGPAQVFHTTPTSELVTLFPLVLVPTFLVPLAFTLHVASLWQLLGGSWARSAGRRSASSALASPGALTGS